MKGGEALAEVGGIVGEDRLEELVADGESSPCPGDLELDLVLEVRLHDREEQHLGPVGGVLGELLLQVLEDVFLVDPSVHHVHSDVEYDKIKCVHLQSVVVVTFLLGVEVRVEDRDPVPVVLVGQLCVVADEAGDEVVSDLAS